MNYSNSNWYKFSLYFNRDSEEKELLASVARKTGKLLALSDEMSQLLQEEDGWEVYYAVIMISNKYGGGERLKAEFETLEKEVEALLDIRDTKSDQGERNKINVILYETLRVTNRYGAIKDTLEEKWKNR